MAHAIENTYLRRPSPNFSDEDCVTNNSESAMTTLPISERKILQTSATSGGGGGGGNNNNNLLDDKNLTHQISYEKQIEQTIDLNGQLTGRNTFAFWTIVTIIFLLTVGNLILTMTIIGVLKLGKGMEYLELVPEAGSVKFFGITDLDRLYKKDGILEGFSDVPVTVTADHSDAQLSMLKPNGHIHNKMLMSKNGTTFHGVNQFELRNPNNGEIIFSTHKPHYNIPRGADNLNAKCISASRITSPIGVPLSVNNTRGKILFRGTEGVSMMGKEIFLSADQHLYLKAHNGSIILNAGGGGHGIGGGSGGGTSGGVYLDVKNLPIVGEHGTKIVTEQTKQYKICVCMPQGKLFRVAVPVTGAGGHTGGGGKGVCSHFNAKNDPCGTI